MPFANCFPTGHSFPPETVFAHAISLTEKHRKLKQLVPQPPEIIVIDLTDCPDEPEKED